VISDRDLKSVTANPPSCCQEEKRYRSISLAIPVVPGLAVGDHEQRSATSDSNLVTNVRKKPAGAICHREKASLVASPHQPPEFFQRVPWFGQIFEASFLTHLRI